MNKKHYKLIIFCSDNYALANETDRDPLTDYNPGIWNIPSQRLVMQHANGVIEMGHTVEVVASGNKYWIIANRFIKELGLSQKLY